MITPKDVASKSMTTEKKAISTNDFFAFYIGRPLSYFLTIPFLYLKFKPKTVSLISFIFPILGFLVFLFGKSTSIFLIGWFLFFIWNLLDGVDGNIARFTNQTSKIGSVYDAMGGYAAMVLSFFSCGIGAASSTGILSNFNIIKPNMYIILGALSGISMLFPRLVMHKKISSFMDFKTVSNVKDKSNFGIMKIIALNLTSVSGGSQILMLFAIFLGMLDLYTICYFILNMLIMFVSLKSILSEQTN